MIPKVRAALRIHILRQTDTCPNRSVLNSEFIHACRLFGKERGTAKHLGIQLVKLPIAALLGSLPTKHGTDGKKFFNRVSGIQLVLDVGPANRSRGLGPQGDQIALAIRKGVHLFFNDIRILTNAAGKKLGAFHDGNPDLLEAEIGKQGRGRLLDVLPQFRFTRQDIFKPSNQLYHAFSCSLFLIQIEQLAFSSLKTGARLTTLVPRWSIIH